MVASDSYCYECMNLLKSNNMTVEEKIEQFIELFKAYGPHPDAPKYFNFTLFGGGSRSYSEPKYWGVAMLEMLVRNGQLEDVKHLQAKLEPQFELWLRFYRFAKKSGMQVVYRHTDSAYINLPEINKEGQLVVPFWYYHPITGDRVKDKHDAVILAVSRLLEHAEIRCLKHPRFRQIG